MLDSGVGTIVGGEFHPTPNLIQKPGLISQRPDKKTIGLHEPSRAQMIVCSELTCSNQN